MLTKEIISRCKERGNASLRALIRGHKSDRDTLFILQNLGALPDDFDPSWLAPLLANPRREVRLWAAKTLGKVRCERQLPPLADTARNDESTEVRREAVAAIGRLREPGAVPLLADFLQDDDPKIILQAVRGLLVFAKDARVQKALVPLAGHPNEMIRDVIRKANGGENGRREFPGQMHVQSPDSLKNVVVLGDVLRVLDSVPDESFHLTFTSPPYYNARDYSIYKSYRHYLEFLRTVFQRTHAKTKEGRFLVVNTSPIIIPRVSRQHSSRRYPIPFDLHALLVAQGWEFIDDIVWAKPESSVKNRNAGFLQHRKPLAYKPNALTEYLMVYRKATDKLIDWNIRQYDYETVQQSKVADGYETSNLWNIPPKHDRVHSAVFPEALCERVIAYYSFRGDLVFDPFGGSGTFGRVAKKLGRSFFLTEQNQKYFDYMKTFLADSNIFEADHVRSDFLTLDEFKTLGEEKDE